MKKYIVIYNPYSGNKTGKERSETLKESLKEDELNFVDITTITSYKDFFEKKDPEAEIIICGGDGTLNRFVNEADGCYNGQIINYFPSGSGNDFAHELGKEDTRVPFRINEYLTDLPVVTIDGKDHKFLNGIGYGIDGYCCEVGDKLRETTDKPINYAGIAIKGLLFHYKPTNAKVVCDGAEYNYKKVWLAPTMNGKCYGGGMMPTPDQDRLAEDRKVSTMLMFGSGKLKTLMIFPSIFKGEHISHTECVNVLTGNTITVSFDRPTALQIDGETVLGVTEYTVRK